MSTVLLVLIVGVVLYFLLKDKKIFPSDNSNSSKGIETIDDKYNASETKKEEDLNRLLDKVGEKGLDKLTKKERKQLEELSK